MGYGIPGRRTVTKISKSFGSPRLMTGLPYQALTRTLVKEGPFPSQMF